MIETARKKIQPYAARLISSNRLLKCKRSAFELKRRLLSQPHKVEVYLRINDPYSYLLVQVLAKLAQRYDIQIQVLTIQNFQSEMYPELSMWHDNAFIDAQQLANLYGLAWPEKAPDNGVLYVNQGTQALLALELDWLKQKNLDDGWHRLEQIFSRYWHQGEKGAEQPDNDTRKVDSLVLERRLYLNELKLEENGHYMSAMIHYAGEWYWGLDRLDHLEKRFNDLGLYTAQQGQVKFNKTYADFCLAQHQQAEPNPRVKKLTLFFSIRSPYSHIGLQQGIKLAQHYQCELDVRPVLPMMMRGLSVPERKKMYIFHDTKREADKLGINYGYVADPLGKGVERCYTLFSYAKSLGIEQQYLLNFAQAVNAEGIHSDTDAGLKVIVERSGMEWNKAKTILDDQASRQSWQPWAEANREEMIALGSWGVPTFQYGDLVLWGQDRVGLIERAIQADINKTE